MLITATLITAVERTTLIVLLLIFKTVLNCLTVDSWTQSISYLEVTLLAFLNVNLDNCPSPIQPETPD